jgi:hypothetical protein
MKTINGVLTIAAISTLAAGAVIAVNAQTDLARQMQLAMNQTDFIERSINGLTVSHKWSKVVMVPAGESERITVFCGSEGSVPTSGGFRLGSGDLQVISSHSFAASTGLLGWAITVNNTNTSASLPAAVDVICLSEGGSSATTLDDDDRVQSDDDDEPARSTDGGDSGTEVIITADGDWSGAIQDSDFNMRSVDGSGDESFSIRCDSGGIYSVSFQKMEESGELTVAVVQDGDVLKESSTTADYGVVSVAGEC